MLFNTAKPSAEILARINMDSLKNKEEVFTRLYRYLLREDVYIAAFQNLYANDGAMTPGIDDDVASGFSMDYVKELIEDLRNGTYKPTPVRRTYIPKKNGKFRPLGCPSFRDKILQEVVRLYLEAIYEPIFDKHSHGFRPKRSCHTALLQLQKEFTGAPWIIEGDIAHCFDSIDHDVLLDILAKKIKDQRFLNVIRLFLRSGYMEDWVYHETYSGAVQGGVISPILMNIYMNEFDKKVSDVGNQFHSLSPVERNPAAKEYEALKHKAWYYSQKVKRLPKEAPERPALIKKVKQLRQDKLRLPSKENVIKKIAYVRYADDWVIAVWGNKAECTRIKETLGSFLSIELKLTLSEEKTLITHSENKIRFLGYDFWISKEQIPKRAKHGSTHCIKRTLSHKVMLSTPLDDKIVQFMLKKQCVKFNNKTGKLYPIVRNKLIGFSDRQIINTYNSEVRGLLNFYCISGNYYKLSLFVYLMEYSCLATLARKFDSTTRKVVKKYSYKGSWSIPYTTKNGSSKRISFVKLDDCRECRLNSNSVDRINTFVPYRKKELWRRIESNKCEICGVPPENDRHCKVLVVKRIKQLGNQPWEKLMKRMHRKTLIVCPTCFKMIQESKMR